MENLLPIVNFTNDIKKFYNHKLTRKNAKNIKMVGCEYYDIPGK